MKTILLSLSLILLVSCAKPVFETAQPGPGGAVVVEDRPQPTPPITINPSVEADPPFTVTAPAAAHETNAAAPAADAPVEAAPPVVAQATPPPGAPAVAPAPAPLPSLPTAVPTASTNVSPPLQGRQPLRNVPPVAGAGGAPNAPGAAGRREEILPAGLITFQATPLESVLTFYAELVNRTLLRPANLGAPQITLKTQTPLTKSEAIRALDTVLAMNGITMITVDDKFVKAVPVGQANTVGAPFSNLSADQLPEFGQYVTHVVQLKFAKPTEMVQVLQPFAQIQGSILPVDSSQIIVLRDYSENVKRMLEMIEQVDIAVPSEFVQEVIPIKYALATEIANALNSLSTGGSSSTVGGGGGSPAGSSGSIGSRGLSGTPQGFSNQRSTTQNRPGYQNQATTGMGQQGGGGGGDFRSQLQNIIRRAQVSGDIQVLGQTKIIADERTNSLLIFASRSDMEMIKEIVSKLDVVLAQVLIEAIVMEVSLDNQKNIGFSYLQPPKTIGNDGFASGVNNVPFLGPNNFASLGTNAAGGLPSGFSYWGKWGHNLEMTLTAFANDNRVNVLSRPRVQTSHAVPAHLFIGNTVPYITGTSFGDFVGTGSRSQYEQRDVGISLDVLPLINPDGLVVMDIQQDIQQLGTPTTIDGNSVPTTTKRQANAKVAVKDRDTIILGGFISTTKIKGKSGVPFLKDVPLLGNLFRSTSDSGQRVELIVMMRPTVLPDPAAAAIVAEQEKNNLPGIRRAEKEIQDDENARLKAAEKELKTEAKASRRGQ